MDPERWRQLDQIFNGAMERAPETRSAFIEAACRGDRDLQREVESFLERAEQAGSFLETPALEAIATALTPGAALGPYQILGLLGAGGMGKVYKARDTRLGRMVAIKVLNERFGPRLEREARAASALNHPNIVTLHDIARDDGIDYLVMEYVPGISLDQLIHPKGLSLAEALNYAIQIAAVLAVAHQAGIMHRDIKPSNVIVTPDSQVKVLDFGLAKRVERAASHGSELTEEPTLTGVGAVVGTAAYMSPEQIGGRPLDHRTDVFSLGVVLYEMLAGHRPFGGKSRVEAMRAILDDSPPPLEHQPPELDEILAKALAKEPRDRYQHAGDLALDLRRFEHAWKAKSLLSMRQPVTVPGRRARLAIVAALVVILAAGTGWWTGRRAGPGSSENPLAQARFTRLTDFEGAKVDAAISPDGRFVAFLADRDGPFDVFLTQAGSGRFVNLTQGKEPSLRSALRGVGFSGDGSEIWLHADDGISPVRTMPLMGGRLRTFLGKLSQNVAWSADGAHIAYHTADPGDPIFVADPTGASAHQILVSRPNEHNHYPAWSPDGRWIYFVRGIPAANQMDVWRVAPSGGEPERLTWHDSAVAYPAPIDGRTLLYIARDANGAGPWLWALDVERRFTRRVSVGFEKYTSVAASGDGKRLVVTVANPVANLWSVPILDHPAEAREVKPFPLPSVRALMPRFGGSALFYLSSLSGGDGLWRYQDGQAVEIWKGTDGALLEPPGVSPDGRWVAFVLRQNGRSRLRIETADGTEPRTLAEGLDVHGAPCWSPDGRWIATGATDAHGGGLFKISVDGGTPVRLTAEPALNPVWSPDGNLIAYAGANVGPFAPLHAVRPDGTPVELPDIKLQRDGERIRFLPGSETLTYTQGVGASLEFWLLDLVTKKTRPLTHLAGLATMRSFDITPDRKHIVFDRLRDNSDVVLIELPK